MSTTALKDTINDAFVKLKNVDRSNADAMFDCLVELELLARDAITDHSIVELLRTNPMSMQEDLPFSTAA